MRSRSRADRAIALGLGLLLPASAAWAQSIGETTSIVRDVQGEIGGKATPLKIGDQLVFLQVIAAGEASAAQTRFIDQSSLSVGANSRVTLDAFVFDPAKPALAATLTSGVLRFVTGQMDKNAYRLRTPTATVGVRGTVFYLIVAGDGASTVYVEDGSVTFANNAGTAVTVTPGLASRIDAQSGPPSPPAPPGVGDLAAAAAMTTNLALAFAPADVLPAAVAERLAALAAEAATAAEETEAGSPGGTFK
jgi:hypothetical protein